MSYFKDLINKGDTSNMIALTDILDEHFTELEVEDSESYWEVMTEIYELIIGEHFDEECVLYAVSEMENEDGTVGAHWTLEETSEVITSMGLDYDPLDWYYVMNMIYSDYYSIIGTDTSKYVAFAKVWLDDKDAPEGKAYKYWRMIKS